MATAAIACRQNELDLFLLEIWPSEKQDDKPRPALPGEPLGLDDEEVFSLARGAANGGSFAQLHDAGDWKGAGFNSQSEADLALCRMYAFWTGCDKDRMDRLFRRSALYREKWNRADYRNKTLDKAVAECREVYKPPKAKSEPFNGESPPIEWPEGFTSEKPTDTRDKATSDSGAEMSHNQGQERPDIEFPREVLSGVALQFAELYSAYTEPPLQFYYFSFLTCLGSILADRATLESQIEPQPRLYTILLGESADDRKSTAIDQTVKFFHRFSTDRVLNVCHGLGSAEGLQERMQEIKAQTGAAKLILFFDEFKSFVSKCKIEGSILLPCVTTLFESNHYENQVKGKSIKLDEAYLSLLAASTIDTFENIWTSQFTDIGFNNRLWLVTGSGERRYSIPRKIPDHEFYSLKRKLNEILDLFRTRFEMSIDEDAGKSFHHWYLNLEKSVHTKRIDTYALRLMPLLAANDGKTRIDTQIVQKATRLCDCQLQTRKLHDPIDADNLIAQMEERIRRLLRAKGPMKERELKRALHTNRTGIYAFTNAVKNLRGAHEIFWDRAEKKYSLSPAE